MQKMKLRLTIFDGIKHTDIVVEKEFNDLKHATQDLFNLKNIIIENVAYNLNGGSASLVKIELITD